MEDLLSIVNCAIVSTTRNSQVDAYVLSESSMFISRRRFILKTCGTTTPLDCIEHLTRLVTEHAKFDTVEVGRKYRKSSVEFYRVNSEYCMNSTFSPLHDLE